MKIYIVKHKETGLYFKGKLNSWYNDNLKYNLTDKETKARIFKATNHLALAFKCFKDFDKHWEIIIKECV